MVQVMKRKLVQENVTESESEDEVETLRKIKIVMMHKLRKTKSKRSVRCASDRLTLTWKMMATTSRATRDAR